MLDSRTMVEGIVVSAVIACIGAYVILRAIHWWDERGANKIRAARKARGSTKSTAAIVEEGKANVLHGWD